MSAGDWKEMYRAAEEGDLELVRYHVSNGINPNYQHPEILSTPLVACVINGHIEIARYLLENGAQADLVSQFEEMTPWQAARHHKQAEIIEMIEARIGRQSWYQKVITYF
ncbi:ankyrin repeat domain-containing protein [Bdellovibrio sp. HCB209]|uniref:ankyrin repeat domain-containing protein n=1 Tax=Bdellovibrio sp. HCB209 TaxID=3394354 RepID=UPI0039B4F601